MNSSTILPNITSLKLMSISIKNAYHFYAVSLYAEKYSAEKEIQVGRYTTYVILRHIVVEIP